MIYTIFLYSLFTYQHIRNRIMSSAFYRDSIDLAFKAGCLVQAGQFVQSSLSLCKHPSITHPEDFLLALLSVIV